MVSEHPQPARAVEGFVALCADGRPFGLVDDPINDYKHLVTVLEGHRAAALEELVAAAEALDVLTVETMSSMSPYAIDGLIEKARAALRRWKGE